MTNTNYVEQLYILEDLQDKTNAKEVTLAEAREFYINLDFTEEFATEEAYSTFVSQVMSENSDWLCEQLILCDYYLEKITKN